MIRYGTVLIEVPQNWDSLIICDFFEFLVIEKKFVILWVDFVIEVFLENKMMDNGF